MCLIAPILRKRPLETQAWETDKIIILKNLNFLQRKKANAINVICLTLLNAIIFFKSDCIKVTTLLSNLRKDQNNTILTNLIFLKKREKSRNRPNPPNFNKRPAKTIDPEVLASTWALGSQKCSPKTGIFTKKGAAVISIKLNLKETFFLKKNFLQGKVEIITKIKGREKIKV